jgi:hypothetical protein
VQHSLLWANLPTWLTCLLLLLFFEWAIFKPTLFGLPTTGGIRGRHRAKQRYRAKQWCRAKETSLGNRTDYSTRTRARQVYFAPQLVDCQAQICRFVEGRLYCKIQFRGVAQLGSARRSGRRGRRFKSSRPDCCRGSTSLYSRKSFGNRRIVGSRAFLFVGIESCDLISGVISGVGLSVPNSSKPSGLFSQNSIHYCAPSQYTRIY